MTGYSAFVFEADKFFEDYSFSISGDGTASRSVRADRFCCQIYLKVRLVLSFSRSGNLTHQALLSVFRGRASERDRDTAVERCEVGLLEDTEQTECRLTIRMICGLGRSQYPYIIWDSLFNTRQESLNHTNLPMNRRPSSMQYSTGHKPLINGPLRQGF